MKTSLYNWRKDPYLWILCLTMFSTSILIWLAEDWSFWGILGDPEWDYFSDWIVGYFPLHLLEAVAAGLLVFRIVRKTREAQAQRWESVQSWLFNKE